MTERKKTGIYLKDNIWAENKPDQCTEPNKGQYPFTENDGWGTPFSEAGGSPVERTTMNRNFNKIGALAYDVNRFGSNLPWEATIAYELGALVIGSDNKTYRAAQASTGQDPVKDASGTYWKFAIFNSITGTDNIKITADAQNNLKVDTAVNLNTKANTSLDNVASGSLVGKFQDGATTNWKADEKKLTVDIKEGSVKATKVDGTDKKSWAAKLGDSANQAETMVKRDGQGIARFFRVGIDSEDSKYDFGYIASVDGNKNAITTSVTNAKRVFGIDAILKEIQTLKQQLADSKITNFKEQHPVGCIWVSYLNQNPPYQNQHNIKWELLPEGYAVMSGKADNTGKTSGANRLDTGTTDGHTLTIEQMPEHEHDVLWGQGENVDGKGKKPGNSVLLYSGSSRLYQKKVGGSKAHNHKMNTLNIKLLLWRRTA